MEKLGELLSSGVRYGLHVRADGAIRQLDRHIFDDISIKVVVLAAIPDGSEWERSLLKVVLFLLPCIESYGCLSAVKVSDNLRLGRALASIAHPTMPLVTRRFEIDWLKDLLRQKFVQESSGLEPFCILEYFRFRLAAAIADSAFDNIPRLREVGQNDFVFASVSLQGGGVDVTF